MSRVASKNRRRVSGEISEVTIRPWCWPIDEGMANSTWKGGLRAAQVAACHGEGGFLGDGATTTPLSPPTSTRMTVPTRDSRNVRIRVPPLRVWLLGRARCRWRVSLEDLAEHPRRLTELTDGKADVGQSLVGPRAPEDLVAAPGPFRVGRPVERADSRAIRPGELLGAPVRASGPLVAVVVVDLDGGAAQARFAVVRRRR